MPDLKISQLPVASTPLAGTELVPIVQGGTTDQTTVQAILTSAVPSGTANGVLYLNGSKVVTSGSALTFDGSTFAVNSAASIGSNTAKTKFYSDSTYNGIFNGASLTAAESVYMGSGGLFFFTSGSEQMRLTSTGLGIGTTSPGTKLEVSSGTGFPTARFARVGTAGQTGALVIGMSQIGFSGSTNADALLRSDYGFGLEVNIASSPLMAMVADLNGNVVIGTAALATNATNGFFYVAGCAGVPTGTPTAFSGRVPIVVDTTNNKLYFYSGGAWRDAGP